MFCACVHFACFVYQGDIGPVGSMGPQGVKGEQGDKGEKVNSQKHFAVITQLVHCTNKWFYL